MSYVKQIYRQHCLTCVPGQKGQLVTRTGQIEELTIKYTIYNLLEMFRNIVDLKQTSTAVIKNINIFFICSMDFYCRILLNVTIMWGLDRFTCFESHSYKLYSSLNIKSVILLGIRTRNRTLHVSSISVCLVCVY